MQLLTDYRSDLDNILATAVDASTWTDAIFDQALRMALDMLNPLLVYETKFTVVSAGYEQDLSTIAELGSVVALAYPWQEGKDFAGTLATWRTVGHNKVYFTAVEPAVGEVIRVRYYKQHMINDLDAATTTTIPDAHRGLIGLWAAAYACDLRQRQISENPALPKEAAAHLAQAAERFRQRAQEAMSHIQAAQRLRWGSVGLE
jgi:hypothetical protein